MEMSTIAKKQVPQMDKSNGPSPHTESRLLSSRGRFLRGICPLRARSAVAKDGRSGNKGVSLATGG
jgi:hypothetical protein